MIASIRKYINDRADALYAAAKRAYVAATNKGPYQLHRPVNYSGDLEVSMASPRVRARVRDMSRNNPMVAGMKLKRTVLIVGPEVGHKALAKRPDGSIDEELNAELEERFEDWAEAAEIGGRSLTECMELVENHKFEDGELLIVDDIDPSTPRGENPYRIRLLENDYLDVSRGIDGIEYNSKGQAITYFLYNRHPRGLDSTPLKTIETPAANVIFIADTTRASQRRGISPIASAIFKLYGVDDLEDAELVASRAGAAYGLIIQSSLGNIANPWQGAEGTSEPIKDNNNKNRDYMEAGGILQLDAGEEAKAFSSDRPNSNFDSFITGRHRVSAGTVGMSYETASGDYRKANFTASRMANIIQWAVFRRDQRKLMRVLNIIRRKWLGIEVSVVGVPGLSPAMYGSNKRNYSRCSWQLGGNEGIDPVKEINALEKEIALGTNTRTRWSKERGRNFAEDAKTLSSEKKVLQDLGIYQEDPVADKTISSSPELEAESEEKGGIDQSNEDQTEDTE